MSQILTISHLKEVRRLLYRCASSWYHIGLELDLEIGTLDTIRAMYSDPRDCLTEMLKVWLKSISPPPTWRYLADALDSGTIGQHALAEEGMYDAAGICTNSLITSLYVIKLELVLTYQ